MKIVITGVPDFWHAAGAPVAATLHPARRDDRLAGTSTVENRDAELRGDA